MIRQSLVTLSALILMPVAGALIGCDKEPDAPADPAATTATAEPAATQPEADEGRAMGHDGMKMGGDDAHGMDMQAGQDLQGDFAHKELVVLDEPVEVPQALTAALGQIHQHYRDMAQTLVADDAAAADAAAKKMREAVEGVSADGLDAEASDAWQSHRKVMRTSLHQMTEADGIAAKRQHFSHISEAMYCANKSFGGIDQPVHVAYCPMALDGKGAYWLADKAEIENPYMGQKMVGCGEVKETM